MEDIYSYLSNSSPVTTLFVDFKSAFDMLWHEWCIGKFRRMGIPVAFTDWIGAWLENRRGFIEINNNRSRWFKIERGGPQGSSLTPTVFISYHADMSNFLSWSSSHLFADDLAAIFAGGIGELFSIQCLDLERRIKSFCNQLEYYCLLTDQPINYSKTECLWSSRAPRSASFNVEIGGNSIKCTKEFKYLGYFISPRLGWGKLIHKSMLKIRQRLALINSFRLFGKTSFLLKRALFSSYILPLFTWLYPIFPLFTDLQRSLLSHFYFTCLKRSLYCLGIDDFLFAYLFDELSLEDRCYKYWNRYLIALADSIDGELIFEQSSLNTFRQSWVDREFSIKWLRVSKRFIDNESVFESCMRWVSSNSSHSSLPSFDMEEVQLLGFFPESFFA